MRSPSATALNEETVIKGLRRVLSRYKGWITYVKVNDVLKELGLRRQTVSGSLRRRVARIISSVERIEVNGVCWRLDSVFRQYPSLRGGVYVFVFVRDSGVAEHGQGA